MKFKRNIIILVIDIAILIIISLGIIFSMRIYDSMRLNVYFGESHAGQSNIAQLFYAEDSKHFSTNYVLTEVFDDAMVSFDVSEIDFDNNIIRT